MLHIYIYICMCVYIYICFYTRTVHGHRRSLLEVQEPDIPTQTGTTLHF